MRSAAGAIVRVGYDALLAFVTEVFAARGVPAGRAGAAAEALCYGDLTGHSSHGVVNLTRLYLPLFEEGRTEPQADPRVLADRGAAVLLDAQRGLGLWVASEAMDLAAERAATHGVGMVSVRAATHLGCAGYHALRAARQGMVGLVASNCGQQRILRPPGGRLPMLGTNPLSVAAPAGDHPPFVLDMSTAAAPTGRVREAARAARPVPEGWLEDERGAAVTDAAAFDRGEAHLLWLGGGPGSGRHKGFGLGVMVEVLAALVSGAGLGPDREALDGDGRPCGQDDDIGVLTMAVAPGSLRPERQVERNAATLFGTLLACPPARPGAAVRYPGWHEAERARAHRRDGVPLSRSVVDELGQVAAQLGLISPEPLGTG